MSLIFNKFLAVKKNVVDCFGIFCCLLSSGSDKAKFNITLDPQQNMCRTCWNMFRKSSNSLNSVKCKQKWSMSASIWRFKFSLFLSVKFSIALFLSFPPHLFPIRSLSLSPSLSLFALFHRSFSLSWPFCLSPLYITKQRQKLWRIRYK